jgi:Tfp pilus assembly protein PilF
MRYTIKWRFLLKLGVVLILAGAGVFFLHRWQVGKQVDTFLRHADTARDAAERESKAGNAEQARAERDREESFLRRYVAARSNDLDARERLGRLLVQNARTGKQLVGAFYFLEDVLRRDPDRDDLRRFTAELALRRLGLYSEAHEHLKRLNEKTPNDGVLEEMYALCWFRERNYPKAAEWYEKAVEHAPDQLGAHMGLALVRRVHLNQPKKADEAIVEMVQVNQARLLLAWVTLALQVMNQARLDEAEKVNATAAEIVQKKQKLVAAHLLAARYWREYGTTFAEVEREVTAAEGIDRNDLDVLIAAAEVARTQARALARDPKDEKRAEAPDKLRHARDLLARARAQEKYQKIPALYLAMAALEAEVRDVPKAIEVINAGLQQVPDHPELLQGLLEYQARGGDAAGAGETLEKLKGKGLPPEVADFQKARVLVLKEDWKEAALLLVSLIQPPPDKPALEPGLARHANILLGRCYEQLGQHANRLAAYTAALERPTPLDRTDPLWLSAKLGLAETYAALGQGADALAAYRTIADAGYQAYWIQVARLEMVRSLRGKPAGAGKTPDEDAKRWAPVEEALAKAEAAVKAGIVTDRLDIDILKATLLHHKGKPAEARAKLEALLKSRRKEAAVWIELAFQAHRDLLRLHLRGQKEAAVWIELAFQDEREGKPQQGLATLAAAEKDGVPDSPELRLARAELLVRVKAPDLPAKLAALAVGADKFSDAQRRALLRGLAEVAGRGGADETASRLWDLLGESRPFDLTVLLARFDRAARAGNVPEMKRLLARIGEIDGENGPAARLASAFILMQEADAAKDEAERGKARGKALALLDGLEREKVGPPLSDRVTLSQALIHDANEKVDVAIAKYEELWARDERNIIAARRLVVLLYRRDKQDDHERARAIAAKIANQPDLGADFLRAAAALLIEGDPEGALKLAAKAVSEDSKDYNDQIWRGRMYWSAKDAKNKALAEARFREAVRLAPEAREAWTILIEYLVAMDRKEEAAKTLEAGKDKVKKAERATFLAVGYAQLGQRDKAIEAYKQARVENPNEVRYALAEAVFLLENGRLADAREAFKHTLAMPSATGAERAAARQGLAEAFANDPDYTLARTAPEVLGPPGGGNPANETPAQRRGRAVVLALQRDRESRLEAIRLLELNLEELTPVHRFLLARLHYGAGNPNRFRVVMADLLKSDKNKIPLYTGFYALWLIRQGEQSDLREAASLIEHLAKTDPDALQTAELKARLALARKEGLGAAREALRAKIEAPDSPALLLSRICEGLGLHDDAEKLLKKYVEQAKEKQPSVVLAVAAYYGRRGRTAEALQIWEESRTKFPAPLVGSVAIGVLSNAKSPAAGDVTKVAKWIEDAAGKAKDEERAALLQQLASVRNLQGDYAGSAALYMQAVAVNPRDALAMNNLAYLLSAKHNKHDEALALIASAKEVIGRTNPDLLDTEALILINKNQAEAARKLMEVVVAEAPTGTAHFHLAQAELACEHPREAELAMRRARELGLKAADLHPLEWPEFERLQKKFP